MELHGDEDEAKEEKEKVEEEGKKKKMTTMTKKTKMKKKKKGQEEEEKEEDSEAGRKKAAELPQGLSEQSRMRRNKITKGNKDSRLTDSTSPQRFRDVANRPRRTRGSKKTVSPELCSFRRMR